MTVAPDRAAEAESEFAIAGMTCASCVRHVAKAVGRVPGVRDVIVNLATERALVYHDAATSDASLIAAIDAAGYGAFAIARDGSGTADDDDLRRREAELARRRTLLISAAALFVPTAILAMVIPDFDNKEWLLCALTMPVWAIVGLPFHRGAFAQARSLSANMDTLVSLGSTAALGLSIWATFARQPTYYETASAIVTLIFAGKYFEAVAKGKSTSAIRGLLALQPRTARVVARDGSIAEIAIDALRAGDRVSVPAGERIPIDGIVETGTSAVDVALVTGEPIPRIVGPGDTVRGGTRNGDGTLIVRATAVGEGTTLAQIIAAVRRAQGSVPPIQRVADDAARVFVPIVLGLAAITCAGWIATGHPWPIAIVAAVSVLVVACPCALGLATPTAIVVGVGLGAKHGILFRDASALERIGACDTVIFDKTGTLTIGRPAVVAASDAILALAATVERGSSHPLAAAIVRECEGRGLAIPAATALVAAPGYGMRALVDDRPIFVGNRSYLEANAIAPDAIDALGQAIDADATRVYVASTNAPLGVIELADRMRPEAPAAIRDLAARGITTQLVSGDIPAAVAAHARDVGIASWVASATPNDKAEIVRALRAAGRRVTFVGDGINDAPALATADVGLAMGGGTHVALETAQAAIVSNDPRAVAVAIDLSRATMRTIRQNLFWAFGYNAILVPLAAFGIVRPMMAAAAMGLSSLFVVGNSLFLRKGKFLLHRR